MITLKAVLVGSSCVGALAIGGVTYATVANPNADLRSDRAAAPAKPAVPAPARPECLPQKPDGLRQVEPYTPGSGRDEGLQQKAESGREAVQHQAQKGQEALPQTPGEGQAAPQPKTLPSTLPKNETKPAPAVGAPGTDCLKQAVPEGAKPAQPAAPEAPQLPKPGALSCESMQPAVPVGSQLERSVMLSRGLGKASKHAAILQYHGQKMCAVTQKWMAKGGQWLQIERVKVPQRYSLQQLREALRVPAAGGVPTSVNGVQGYQSPVAGVVLWYAPDGMAVFVSGSQVYTTQVQDVAAKLQSAWMLTHKAAQKGQDDAKQGTDVLQGVR